MTEMHPSSISISTSDARVLNSTAEDVLERIGQNVLSSWDSESENSLFSASTLNIDPLQQIESILSTSPDKLPQNWDVEVRSLIKKLSPTDFAVYGKRICLLILDAKVKTSTKAAPSAQINRIVTSQKSKSIEFDEEKIFHPPIRSERSFIWQIKKSPPNISPQILNAQIYNEFPPWLPTLTEF